MINNFEKIRQIINLNFSSSKTIEDAELELLKEEVVLIEKTQCEIKESSLTYWSYNNYYMALTNFRIVVWFNQRGLMENKIPYRNFWYPNPKNTQMVKPLDIFLSLYINNIIIYKIKYGENKKGKFIIIRTSKWIPSYSKIYHENAALIYEKINIFTH